MYEVSSEFTHAIMPRVLIVDDEESMRATLKRFLTDAGFDVILATGSGDALAILAANDFDVAVIDRILPQSRNGVHLIKEIKSAQPFCQTILVSGYPSFESAAETLRDGTFAYLAKPFERDIICHMVEEAALQGRRKREEARLTTRIAHKINNLLQAITGHCQILLDGADAESAAAQQLAAIYEAAQLIGKLTHELMESGRPRLRVFNNNFTAGKAL